MIKVSEREVGYLLPPVVLACWGGIFLELALAGRLRVLLNPLFWPMEELCGLILVLMAGAYLILFRPVGRGQATKSQARAHLFRVAVLIIPLITAARFAPASFSAGALERRAGLAGGRILARANSSIASSGPIELVDLAAAAYYPEHIPSVTGKHVSYLGQFFPGSDHEFRFCRVLMSCCASDATPIYLHVVGTPPKLSEMSWMTLEGDTFFRKDDGEWTPCVRLTKITPSQQPPDPYLYPTRIAHPK